MSLKELTLEEQTKIDEALLALVKNAGDDFGEIEPRQWLLGNYWCRKSISSLIAEGATGKTAVRLVQALCVATGRQLLNQQHVFQQGRVLFLTLEDDVTEIKRRLKAGMQYHNVTHEEVRERLYYADLGSKGLKFNLPSDKTTATNQLGNLERVLELYITTFQIDLLILDPFVKSHSAPENDNNAIDYVMGILSRMAIRHNMAIDVPHHVAKGMNTPGNSNNARGASAMRDAARIVHTLTRMSKEEARDLNVSEEERYRFVRIDPGKINMAPSGGNVHWLELKSVNLGNCTSIYPNGDNVQTVDVWQPTRHVMHSACRNQILAEIDRALPNGFYSDAANSTRYVGKVFESLVPGMSKDHVKETIARWLNKGILVRHEYTSHNRNKTNGIVSLWKKAKLDADPVYRVKLERLEDRLKDYTEFKGIEGFDDADRCEPYIYQDLPPRDEPKPNFELLFQ